jgi:hypothetical protein
MVGNLTTAVDLHNGNIAGIEYMLCPTRLPLSEDRLVTQHPYLVITTGPRMFGEIAHRVPERHIVLKPLAALLSTLFRWAWLKAD